MKRVWILAGETVHIEGIPCRVAEDAAVDCNPHNLKLLEHVRFRDTPPKVLPREYVPEGFKLVPIEPTKEMIQAGREVIFNTQGGVAKPIYRAMVQAAPSEFISNPSTKGE